MVGLELWSARIIAAVALLCVHLTACRADDVQPVAGPALAPITLAEMRTALDARTPIDRRLIKGQDLSALVADQLGAKGGCDDHRGLIVTNSTIEGPVDLGPRSRADRTAEEEEAESAPERPTDASQTWLRVPLVMRASTINNRMRFESIGFTCKVDMSETVFRDSLLLTGALFGEKFKVDGSKFQSNLGVFGVEWLGPASFKQATFDAIAEFISKRSGEKTVFHASAEFVRTDFTRGANFLGIDFRGQTNFASTKFGRAANFTNTKIHGRFGPAGPFYMTEFSGPAIFRFFGFSDVAFYKTVFKEGADFHFAHGKNLVIRIVGFPARVDLSDAKIDKLEIDDVTVGGETNFQRASVNQLDIHNVDFRKTVDFDEAVVGCAVRFDTLAFGGDLRFEDTKLPSATDAGKPPCDRRGMPAFMLKDVTFDNGVYAAREQILTPQPWWALLREARPRFGGGTTPASAANESAATGEERRLWRELVHGFEATGNLDLKNYAAYRLAFLEEQAQDQPERSFSAMARWFWGYGFRPWRVLWWIAAVVTIYAAIYWTQLAAIGVGETWTERAFQRVRHAVVFSSRTALEFTYGFDNSATNLFKAITTSESLIVKLLLACFFYALTQTSPLLSELVKKLIP